MKEIIRPFDLDEIKVPLIHGETDIVLKNVKTGLIERIHSENTFQATVLAKKLRRCGSINYTSRLSPHQSSTFWQTMVGGILLFKNAIDTSGGAVEYMPAGNKMIGNGSYGVVNNGVPTELGSYNSSESSASASAITQVYDYTTSQANGTIGCICLTSSVGGKIGYGNPSGDASYSNVMNSFCNSDSDATYYSSKALTKDKFISISVNSEGVATVSKKNIGIETVSVFQGFETSKTFDISESLPSNARSIRGIYDVVADGIVRVPCDSGTVASGGTLYYLEYNATADTLTVKTFTNSSSVSVYSGSIRYFQGDYAIACTSGDSYVFDVSDSSLVGQVPFRNWNETPRQSDFAIDCISNGLFVGKNRNTNNTTIIYDAVADEFKPINLNAKAGNSMIYSSFTLNPEYDLMYFIGGNTPTTHKPSCLSPLYLATINNLQSPVTKTAAQTMKVTYTLTEA